MNIKGIPISQGVAIGSALILNEMFDTKFERFTENPEREIERLKAALSDTKRQITRIVKQNDTKSVAAEVILNQKNLLVDPVFNDETFALILEKHYTAEYAVMDMAQRMHDKLQTVGDDFFAGRAIDILDIGQRICNCLCGTSGDIEFLTKSIVVAHEIKPSQIAQFPSGCVIAIVTETGGKTSHTAILARAKNIAAVSGCSDILAKVQNGDKLIVDGTKGTVCIAPNEKELESAITELDVMNQEKMLDEQEKETKLAYSDGKTVLVAANIGNIRDAELARENGADAIGLFRTEFLFLERSESPSEQEQFECYRQIAELFADSPVIIRTLDVGGDKQLPYLNFQNENNPFLGLRAIRLCFRNEAIFKTQLRAILRASKYGDIKIMFPMICTLSELCKAKAILEACKADLRKEGISFNENIPTGMMIEVPAAALLSETFSREVDFFSIGTNDLTQYTLAVDRDNVALAELYDETHPAILSLVSQSITSAHKSGIFCGICGGLASNETALQFLIDNRLDEFSVEPGKISNIKRLLKNTPGIIST